MSDSAYLKTRPAKRPENRATPPSDDYEDSVAPAQNAAYDQTEEDNRYEDYDGYYTDEYEEEEAVVSVNRNRALAIAASFVILIAIFGVATLLLVNQPKNGITPVTPGALTEVPVITGFNATTSGEDQAPVKGKIAPDFVWQEGGKTVSLSSFRGKQPVFVNFWGTWCPPCRAEMPEMRSLYNTAGNDVEVIGISMGPRDWPQSVMDFINKTNYNWKFIHDNDYGVASRYQVNSIPSSYFIDKNGVIQDVHVGAMTRAMMDNYVKDVH
jgi:peroxiredoxin